MDINQRFDLLKEEDVAALCGFGTVRSLRNERSAGRGPPYIRLGGDLRGPVKYRRKDVDAWLSKRTVNPAKDKRPTLASGATHNSRS
jgi:hypothetical protein